MQSYSPNVDYLMTDPAIQKICQIADVPTDSCSVAFLDAKVSCGKLDPKNKNILLKDVVSSGEADDYNFAQQFFEKVEEKASLSLNCNHLDLIEYGNYEEIHSEKVVNEVQNIRENLRNMVVDVVTVPDEEVVDEPNIDTESDFIGDDVVVPPPDENQDNSS